MFNVSGVKKRCSKKICNNTLKNVSFLSLIVKRVGKKCQKRFLNLGMINLNVKNPFSRIN